MNIFLFVIFCSFIVSINADFTVVQQIPKINISLTTNQFSIESKNTNKSKLIFYFCIYLVNQTVNRPAFQAFIHIYNATSNASIYQIDVHNGTFNVTYSNDTLTFYLPNSVTFQLDDQFYITFDAGVLFSSNTTNSTAQTGYNFWYLTVIDDGTSTSATTMAAITSMGTTHIATSHSDTSAFITSAITTYTSMNPTTQNLTSTTPEPDDTNQGII
jgi:hypothetical protein